MATLEMTFALSAPARRALGELHSPRSLEFIAERFFDTMTHERYRDFAVTPGYYTTPHGNRQARSGQQKPQGEKRQSLRARLTIKTFRGMKKFEARGLALTWQMEEILFFGFKQGLIGEINPSLN